MARRHVLTASYSSVLDDPRVMMEGTILAGLGYRVSVVGVAMGALPGRSTANGLDIVIVPLVNSYRPGAFVRAILALISGDVLSDSAPNRESTYLSLFFFNLWVLRLGLTSRPSVIHCQEHQPLPAAWLLARLLRVKLVYDSHENTRLNRSGIGTKGALTVRIEAFFIPRVDAIITVGERLARSLMSRGARRVVVVGNWKRRSDFDVQPQELALLRESLSLPPSALVVSYLGLLDPTRDIEPLLDAVAAMPDVHLLIAGRGALEGRVEDMARLHPNFHWLGWLPLRRVATYTMLSDVIYCSINPSLNQIEFQMPNKLFDAFVAGKAVIARRDIGEMSELLRSYPAAIELRDVTSESVREALRRLQDPDVLRMLQTQASLGGRAYNSELAESRLQELFQDLSPAAQPT